MKKEAPHRKCDQKSRRSEIDLESKRKSMGNIYLHHHHQPSYSDNSDENKDRSNEGKENTDFRFRVVSEEDQYKYSLHPDMVQYANVNFDTYIKKTDLIKAFCKVKTL